MNRLPSIFFIILFCFVSVTNIQAQEKKQIKIEYAGTTTIDEEKAPGAITMTRDDSQQVHIKHGSIDLWCDKAIQYRKEKFIEAYGHVRMIEGDTINMTSKYLEYSGETELAFASGKVVLKDPNSTITSDTLYYDKLKQESFYKNGGTVVKDSTGTITSKIGRYYMNLKKYQFVENVVLTSDDAIIHSGFFDFYSDSGHAYLFGPSTITTEDSKTYCEKGFYNTENKVGYALKNAKIDYDDREILGDSLYFDNNISFASATNNIKVTDTINHSIIKGHYAEIFKEKDSLFITKRALAITVQENDSIYMHADKIMVTGKPEHRIVKAYYNAKLYKSDISAKADSIHADQKTGLTQLINLDRFDSSDAFSTKRKPILWNIKSQMTGDTIHLISNPKTEKLDSLLVYNNAFIINKDTLSDNGYSQIYGIHLKGWFNKENTLRKININKNAESIFYLRNDKDELIGIDKAKSGSISMLFENGDIEEYNRINQADGKTYPQSQYPEKEQFLKGFDWREDECPLSVEDLFKDDEPLVLPIIKGLDDYIPQDAFFDDEMMERIKLTGKNTPINQVVINIPEEKNQKKILSNNLIEYSQDFSNNIWFKHNIIVKPNIDEDPNSEKTADAIIGLQRDSGSIFQKIEITKGNIMWAVWAKGKGNIQIMLQENGGDSTVYKYLDIELTNKWEKYKLIAKKDDDNILNCIITKILISDNVNLWGAELFELSN
ncbi:OstA-like protein [Thalassobellus sediminis]|uniref:OstA-like protein n=1 Tax=Thalassobellus sediminis TaxID=3367753 RepID=UPI0037BB61CD